MNINKKIAMSGMSILSALVLLGGTAFAAFSGQATQTNNTFSTGNAELQIAQDVSNSPGVYSGTIAGPTFTGIKPGDTQEYTFWLKNNSDSDVDLDTTADVSAIAGTQALDDTMLISWICDTELDGFGNNTATPEYSPRAWLNGGTGATGVIPAGQQAQCKMLGTLPSSADNTVAGQTAAFDVVYDGVQTP